ncbi:MAG: prepilin peptidase [Candidatus Omnitrophica bacterium]|nr:prepilin peptidase [Candidatus Omnitrophota bacterium]
MGSIVGSFLNVCIYRLPRGESLVFPSSHCVYCNHNIYWFDNIPFFSYIFLRGRCRFCRRPISPRYFLVELLTALLWLTLFMVFGLTPKFFCTGALASALVISTFIDFEFQIIPDVITISGMLAGLIAAVLFPSILAEPTWKKALLNSFLGVIAGGGSTYLIGVLGKMAFKKDAMGGGDVKLMGMIGAFLGWKFALLVFFIAPFFGSFIGIILKIRNKVDIIPYGPYISLATIIVIFWGAKILNYLFL